MKVWGCDWTSYFGWLDINLVQLSIGCLSHNEFLCLKNVYKDLSILHEHDPANILYSALSSNSITITNIPCTRNSVSQSSRYSSNDHRFRLNLRWVLRRHKLSTEWFIDQLNIGSKFTTSRHVLWDRTRVHRGGETWWSRRPALLEKLECATSLPLLTGSFWFLLVPSVCFWIPLGLTGPCCSLLVFTCPYRALLGLTGPYWSLLGLTWP